MRLLKRQLTKAIYRALITDNTDQRVVIAA
jgi:hypothetical protein